MKARTIHQDLGAAGLPLTRSFQSHLLSLKKSDAKNPEVQNGYDRALARHRTSPGPDISFSGNEAKPLFYNTGSGFVEIGTTLGLARTEDSRGMVLVDLDNDGSLDVVLHNYFQNPLVALLNRAGRDGRWIRIRLSGTKSNRFGVGARVTVNGKVQELGCGSGYLSGNAPELHFGLGQATEAQVSIRWPSGLKEEYPKMEPNRVYTFVEGNPSGHRSEELRRESIEVGAPSAGPEEPDIRAYLRELVTLNGQPARSEEPLIAILFSVHCHACIGELKKMADWEERARELGIRLAWVTVDPEVDEVEKEFRLNGANVRPLRPGRPFPETPTPTVYLLGPGRLEKFTGRYALPAAFADAGDLKK